MIMSRSRYLDRRTVLAASAAAAASSMMPAQAQTGTTRDAIRSFQINVPDADLAELRRRIKATRWPDRETVSDESQGVQLATMQELASYWSTDYDWRKCEAKLNALPQFVTEIDGLDIYFIHVRSKHDNALPLIVTHGWPGSVIEQLKIIDPVTDPTAYGASASDAFHVVIPSIPGYGFSARPTTTGWGPDRTARAWTELMKRLGYTPLRGARRRCGCGRHGHDGAASASGIAGLSHQLSRHDSSRHCEGAPVQRSTVVQPLGRRKTRLRAALGFVCEATRLRQHDGDAAANLVQFNGFARQPGSLDARPRRRLRTAGGGDHVCRDRAHGQWSSR